MKGFSLLALMMLTLLAKAQRNQVIYSIENEEQFLQHYFKGIENKFYVDMGALHPICYSNTVLLTSQKWNGLNIDANYDKMKMFYYMRKNQINLNIAASNNDEFQKFFVMTNPFWSTLVKNVTEEKEAGQIAKQLNIPSFSLATICERFYLEKPLFMNLDVEGIGYQVLKSNNWSSEICRPQFIISEFNKVNVIAGSPPIDQYLKSINYTWLDKLGDNQYYVSNQLKEKYAKIKEENLKKIKSYNGKFYRRFQVQSDFINALNFKKFLVIDSYFYDPITWEFYLKIAQKDQTINIKNLQEQNVRHANKNELKSRPIVIMQLEPARCLLFLESKNYTISKIKTKKSFEFFNLTIYPQSGSPYIVYIYDAIYQQNDTLRLIFETNLVEQVPKQAFQKISSIDNKIENKTKQILDNLNGLDKKLTQLIEKQIELSTNKTTQSIILMLSQNKKQKKFVDQLFKFLLIGLTITTFLLLVIVILKYLKPKPKQINPFKDIKEEVEPEAFKL